MVERTVLLLEATDRALVHLETVLHDADFRIVRAFSFLEAFQTLKSARQHLCLVILDFDLTTDEPEVMQRLRRLELDRPLPVVLMGEVSLSAAEIKQLCIDSGFSGYICKQTSSQKILKTLLGIIGPEHSQRRYPRVLLHQRVHCEFSEQTYLTEVFDLSLGGLFLRMSQDLPPIGTRGTVTLPVDPQNKFNVKFDIEVIYVCSAKKDVVSIFPAGVGAKFVDLDSQREQYLRILIERYLKDVPKQDHMG